MACLYYLTLALLGQYFYVLSMNEGLRFFMNAAVNIEFQGLKLQVCVNENLFPYLASCRAMYSCIMDFPTSIKTTVGM